MTEFGNATMSLHIGPDGAVRRMAIGYDASYGDRGRLSVRYSYHVTGVGTTNVTPPAWLDAFDGAPATATEMPGSG